MAARIPLAPPLLAVLRSSDLASPGARIRRFVGLAHPPQSFGPPHGPRLPASGRNGRGLNGRWWQPASYVTQVALAVLLSAGLAQAEEPAAGAAGSVSVFSDQVAFAIDAPAPEQKARGYFGGGSISGLYPTEEPGHLLMVTPPGDAVVGRRFDLPLANMQFLTWDWRRLPIDIGQRETLTNDAPMRLIIGFIGGTDGPSLQAPPPSGGVANELPPFDRALVVTWSDDPWESGTAARHGGFGHFVAHGGPPDGQWWQQSVDLAELHSRLWPGLPLSEVRIAWVAVGVRRSSGRSIGEVAGIALAP